MVARFADQMITAEMNISEVVTKYPQTIKVFFNHGMQCTGCYICGFHSISDSARECGAELESLLNDLNDASIAKDPQGFRNPEAKN